MDAESRLEEALGRIAVLLVDRGARVGLNGIWDVLNELDRRAFEAGYEQRETDADSIESYRRKCDQDYWD
ncbi:MAG: hypothetical protein ACLQD8_03570 [Thermoplasmata archaeon]